jgi:type IV pilus assembly protein PilB
MALGDNLISKGHITPGQLEMALAEQKKNPGERIGEILIRLGFVTKQQVDSAL